MVDTKTLLKVRKFLQGITVKKAVETEPGVPKLDENGKQVYIQEAPALVVMLDNEHSAEEQIHPLLWDDNNSLLIYFTSNVDSSMSMMVGTDHVPCPMMINVTEYAEIQRIRVVCNEEIYYKYINLIRDKTAYDALMDDGTLLTIQDQITDQNIKNIYEKFFGATDAVGLLTKSAKPNQIDFSKQFQDIYGVIKDR